MARLGVLSEDYREGRRLNLGVQGFRQRRTLSDDMAGFSNFLTLPVLAGRNVTLNPAFDLD